MRSDGHSRSNLLAHGTMPAIDHEAEGPISALVQLTTWLGRLWASLPARRAAR